jgi:thiaminase
MEASVRAEAHAFLEQIEQQYEPALAVIRNHPFVQGVAQGTVPLAILRHFAHAEYWYMRGGVSILPSR